jgi:hypothetical protein
MMRKKRKFVAFVNFLATPSDVTLKIAKESKNSIAL